MSREMKDSGIEWIGEMPQGWKSSKVKYIASVCGRIGFRGYTVDDLVEQGMGAITLSPTNIINNALNLEKCSYLSWDKYDESPEIQITEGDIVFVKTASVGKVAFVNELKEKMTINPQFVVLKNTKVNNKYLFYVFLSDVVQNQLQLDLFGGVIKTITQYNINNYIVPISKLEKQHQIATYLDSKVSQIDIIIQKQTQLIEEYKTYKQSLITETVTKGLNPNVEMKDSGIEWIGMVPTHWKMVRIKTLFKEVNERNEDEGAILLSLFTAIGVKPRNEMEDKGNKAVTVINYKKVQKGDLVVNKLLAWMGAIAYSDYEGVTSPDYDVYRALADANVIQEYYNMYFRYTNFKDDCYKYGRGIMMMRWRTYPEQFKSIFVVNPPKEEQKAIIVFLKNKCIGIDTLITRKQSLIQELETYKKSLIYECVTGKREIPTTYEVETTLEQVAATQEQD